MIIKLNLDSSYVLKTSNVYNVNKYIECIGENEFDGFVYVIDLTCFRIIRNIKIKFTFMFRL